MEKGIQWLGTLSQDSDSWVRKQAIQSLGKVHSQAAVPFLQLALQDPDMEIVAIASAIMQTYKGYTFSANSARENLPKNSALKAEEQPE
ncbi:MAG: HEAT repeat domain-containing protein [Halothece sp.]